MIVSKRLICLLSFFGRLIGHSLCLSSRHTIEKHRSIDTSQNCQYREPRKSIRNGALHEKARGYDNPVGEIAGNGYGQADEATRERPGGEGFAGRGNERSFPVERLVNDRDRIKYGAYVMRDDRLEEIIRRFTKSRLQMIVDRGRRCRRQLRSLVRHFWKAGFEPLCFIWYMALLPLNSGIAGIEIFQEF